MSSCYTYILYTTLHYIVLRVTIVQHIYTKGVGYNTMGSYSGCGWYPVGGLGTGGCGWVPSE